MTKRRNHKWYDGTRITNFTLKGLLPQVLGSVFSRYNLRPDLIFAAWDELIGPNFKEMTEAVSFQEGVLVVKVKNSTLFSLLNMHEKARLTKLLQEKFPGTDIKTIQFRIG